jgi:hypothetical protein
MNYSSRFFDLKTKRERNPLTLKPEIKSRKKIMIQVLKISTYFIIFISIWFYFTLQFGLTGIFYTSIFLLIAYIIIKSLILFLKGKGKREKFNLIESIKNQYDENAFAYTILCTGIFLGLYISFSLLYPFVFVFPSNSLSVILALSAYPLYIVFEIFYRKIIYPELYFIKSKKSKTILITILAIINQLILISLNLSWAFLPAVLVFYMIFLIVIIKNSIIYAKTEKFITVIIGSFIIIEIFFGAAISQALGIYSVLNLIV